MGLQGHILAVVNALPLSPWVVLLHASAHEGHITGVLCRSETSPPLFGGCHLLMTAAGITVEITVEMNYFSTYRPRTHLSPSNRVDAPGTRSSRRDVEPYEAEYDGRRSAVKDRPETISHE